MLKIKSIKILVTLGFIVSFGLSSCEWKEYDPEADGIENVSFTNDIMPIFNQSCNTIGCHSENGIAPDLSPANAFQDLRDKNMIDLTTPENSELYIRMTDIKSPMPLDGILSGQKTKTVLVWIQEGAQNN